MKKVSHVKPVGSQILVEFLTAQEQLNTSMILNEESNVGATQGYILAFGPALKHEDWGLAVGDRVLLQGTYVPVPVSGQNNRKCGLVEVHNVKGVLVEEV